MPATLLLLEILLAVPYVPGKPAEDTLMATLAGHPLFDSLLSSLTFDTDNQLFPMSLRLFLAVLPYSPERLTPKVPLMMIILGRAIIWRYRRFHNAGLADTGFTPTLRPNEAINRDVATSSEMTELASSLRPERIVKLLLVAIYSAWPSNVLAFIRDPVAYLKGKAIEPQYDASWEVTWDAEVLVKYAEPLLRDFHLHPSLIRFSSAAELADISRWSRNDPSRFVTRSHMLAHSELSATDRVKLFELEQDATEVEASVPIGLPGELTEATHARANEVLRLEAAFGDRVRKLYLHSKLRARYLTDPRHR
jgi:hypothetical protein